MDIGGWLRGLGLERYEQAFRDNEINERVLPKLTADDLKELGVNALGHRRLLLDAIATLRDEVGPRNNALTVVPAPEADAARNATEAERRQLTVMFCDLVGSTPLSSRLDPEDLREVIGVYHRCVAETVGRYAGYVAKYMGDGILIYFGYPQAHEDDAERSVRAGLAVINAVAALDLPQALSVRLGVASGLVVVGDLIGEGSAQEHGVVGETPNLAARLQALAPANCLVIADSTRRQLGGFFDVEDLGPQALAGFAEPQRAWQVVGESEIVSRFEALRSGATALIGRDEEIDLLLRRWQRAKGGEGRVLLVSGEPGIGKSRLSEALLERIAEEPRTRLRYFSSPHRQDSALYPFIAQLERAAGFCRGDTPEQKRSRLDVLLASGATAAADVALIAELLSLPNDAAALGVNPQQKRAMLFQALLRQLDAVSGRQPVLMIFEDAHWADPTSRELLDLIVDRVQRLPVLLIVTFRPEFQPQWGGQAHVTSLSLNRLGGRDVATLVRGLAGQALLNSEMIEEIVERTDGVPLFVEELTKAVLERADQTDKVAAVLVATPSPGQAVPATLQASLIARLDRIGASAKEVAQIGALLGREFSYELIEVVARRGEIDLRAALARLTEAGLLFCRGEPPHSSYLFKHALVQDAAYGTLLRSRRRQLHALAGEAIREQFPEMEEREPEILARHFQEGGLTELAIGYWHKAGEHALQRSANAEASAHLRAAIELITTLPADPSRKRKELDLHMALGTATRAIRGHAADETLRVYSHARDLLDNTIPVKEQMAVLYGLWSVDVVRADSVHAREVAEQSLAAAERQSDPEALAFANRMTGWSCWVLGDFANARLHLQRVVPLYEPGAPNVTDLRYSQDHAVWSLSSAALALVPLGYPDQAATAARKSLSWAHDIQHAMTTGFALWTGSTLNAFFEVDVIQGGAHSERALAYCIEHDLKAYIPFSQFYHGWTLAQRGEHQRGLELMQEGMLGSEKISMHTLRPTHLGFLARAHAMAGDVDLGLELSDQAIGIAEATEERLSEAELHRWRGKLLIELKRGEQAEAEFDHAVSIARKQQARMFELRAATDLARLWSEQGRREEAHELLKPVYGWFSEGFDTVDLKNAKALLDQLG